MKVTVRKPVEIEVSHIRITLPVRYEEEDIPNDFPFRKGDVWEATVEMDTGKIVGWPACYGGGSMYIKVVDGGTYTLLAPDGSEVAKLDGDYVPDEVIPGDCGDYVDFKIDTDGIITNWYDIDTIDNYIDAFFPAN